MQEMVRSITLLVANPSATSVSLRRQAHRRWRNYRLKVAAMRAGTLFLIARTAKHLAGRCAGEFAVLDHRNAVHQNIFHSFGNQIGLPESCAVAHRQRIEENDIGCKSGSDSTAVI